MHHKGTRLEERCGQETQWRGRHSHEVVVMAAAAMAEVKVVSLVARKEGVEVVGGGREGVAKVVMAAAHHSLSTIHKGR